MSTIDTSIIKSKIANTPVRFNDSGNVEVGTLCRAWVNFNGTGTVAIRASFNVDSITDEALGQWQVNFTNAMPDANYCCQVTTGNSTDGNNAHGNIRGAKDTTHVHVGSLYPGQYWYDNEYVDVAIFR